MASKLTGYQSTATGGALEEPAVDLLAHANLTDTALPSYMSPDVAVMLQRLRLTRSLRGGTATMRAGGSEFLPQFALERSEQWRRRRDSTFLLGAYAEAIEDHADRIFGEPITYHADLSEQMRERLRDVDLQGTPFQQFAREWFLRGEDDGLCHVLVDRHQLPPRSSNADADQIGARAFARIIPIEDLLGFSYATQDQGYRTTMIRWQYFDRVPEGFGSRWQRYVKAMTATEFRVWREVGELWSNEWEELGGGTHQLGEIGLVTFYSSKVAPFIARPYMRRLAWKELEHWQSGSEQRSYLKFSRFPWPVFYGFDEGEYREMSAVGPGVGFRTTKSPVDAKVELVETSGESLQAGERDLERIERHIEVLAREPLLTRRSGNITATREAIQSARSSTSLQDLAFRHEHAGRTMIQLMARFDELGEEPWESIKFATDLTVIQDNDQAALLLAARRAGEITRRTFLQGWAYLEVIPNDVDIEDEIERLEAEAPTLQPEDVLPLDDEGATSDAGPPVGES